MQRQRGDSKIRKMCRENLINNFITSQKEHQITSNYLSFVSESGDTRQVLAFKQLQRSATTRADMRQFVFCSPFRSCRGRVSTSHNNVCAILFFCLNEGIQHRLCALVESFELENTRRSEVRDGGNQLIREARESSAK